MTLENKLFELATLVDYGTYYLTKEPKFSIRNMAMYISENSIDPSEFYDAWDVVHTYYASDLLSEMHEDDIVNYAVGNNLIDNEEVLDDMTSEEILRYVEDTDNGAIVDWVRDHYDARDLVDLDISVDWQ